MTERDPRTEELPAKRYHRIRFYEHAWSNFDEIKKCVAPCWGCQFKHPFCDENGRILIQVQEI